MSDPKKTFMCSVCGCMSNDAQRRHGKDSKCLCCLNLANTLSKHSIFSPEEVGCAMDSF